MKQERYRELDKSGGPLSKDEMAQGWHYCAEWDQMLVGPEMHEEMAACRCKHETKRQKQ